MLMTFVSRDWYAVVREDAIDVRAAADDEVVELVTERVIVSPHAIEMSNDRGKVAGESVGSTGRSASGVGAVRAKNPAIGPQTSADVHLAPLDRGDDGQQRTRIGVVAEDRDSRPRSRRCRAG